MTTKELHVLIRETVEVHLGLRYSWGIINGEGVDYYLQSARITEHGKFRKVNIVGDLDGKKHDLYILDDEHARRKIELFFRFALLK